LDIRDGAIEFLTNVYKRVLPSLGDYLTSAGGVVNLANVDVILAEASPTAAACVCAQSSRVWGVVRRVATEKRSARV
jgi:5'-3' exonuclease